MSDCLASAQPKATVGAARQSVFQSGLTCHHQLSAYFSRKYLLDLVFVCLPGSAPLLAQHRSVNQKPRHTHKRCKRLCIKISWAGTSSIIIWSADQLTKAEKTHEDQYQITVDRSSWVAAYCRPTTCQLFLIIRTIFIVQERRTIGMFWIIVFYRHRFGINTDQQRITSCGHEIGYPEMREVTPALWLTVGTRKVSPMWHRLFHGPYCATYRWAQCLCVKPFGMWNRLQSGVVITRSSITWSCNRSDCGEIKSGVLIHTCANRWANGLCLKIHLELFLFIYSFVYLFFC